MKPTISPVWTQLAIFVYEASGTSPKATLLNRNPTIYNNLFYTNLIVNGAMNRAGTAKFSVVDTGVSTSDEKSLFTDDGFAESTKTPQRYVVIILGQDVIWSGKILRSVSKIQSPYSTTTRFGVWDVECESDVGKMKLQSVNPPTPPKVTGKVGEIISILLKKKTDVDIDWTGQIVGASPELWDSVISNEGASLSYNIIDSDMFTQFISFMKLSGFEWRTRLANWVGAYSTSNFTTNSIVYLNGGTGLIVYDSAPRLATGDPIFFQSPVPPKLKVGVVYYAIYYNDTYFQISATPGGGFINFTFGFGSFYGTYSPAKVIINDASPLARYPYSQLNGKWVLLLGAAGAGSTVKNFGKIDNNHTTFNMDTNYTGGTADGSMEVYYWVAQQFQPTQPNLEYVVITLKKTGSPTGNLTISIEDDGGYVYNSVIFDVTNLTTSYVQYSFALPCIIPCGGNRQSWVTLKGQAAWVPGTTVCVNYKSINTGHWRAYGAGSWAFTDHAYLFDMDTYYKPILVRGVMETPSYDGRYAVLLDPVVDAAWDTEQLIPVQTLCVNKPSETTNFLIYDYNDSTDKKQVATKVTVKGKNIDSTESSTGKSDSISTTLYAVNKWEPEATMFENTTVVTRKMDGYIHDCVANDPVLHLYGQDYALQVGDVFDCWCKWADNSTPELLTNRTITTLSTTYPQPDGTKTTSVGFSGGVLSATKDCAQFSVFSARKMYVQDNARVYVNNASLWCGGANSSGNPSFKTMSSMGSDPVYGQYIIGETSYGSAVSQVRPIFPGCLVSRSHGGETPNPNSPQALLGIISVVETVDQATTLGDLEVYATQSLINHSFYTRKGSFTCYVNNFLKPGNRVYGQVYDWQMIKEGDRIAIQPSSILQGTPPDTLLSKSFDGQYKYVWEVIAWTLNSNDMTVDVEIGDYEPNVNTLINDKTSALDRTIS